MPQLKLKVKKAGSKHPVTKQLGFAARVLTNGTMEFDDIVKDAIKSAKLVWAKASDEEEEDENGGGTPSGGDTPGGGGDTPGGGDNNGGGGGTDGGSFDVGS